MNFDAIWSFELIGRKFEQNFNPLQMGVFEADQVHGLNDREEPEGFPDGGGKGGGLDGLAQGVEAHGVKFRQAETAEMKAGWGLSQSNQL